MVYLTQNVFESHKQVKSIKEIAQKYISKKRNVMIKKEGEKSQKNLLRVYLRILLILN